MVFDPFTLFVAVALFVVGQLLIRPPDVEDAQAATFDEFNLPSTDPTRRITHIWGNTDIRSSHCMSVFGYHTTPIKIETGTFFNKSKQTVGFEYFASLQMGICRGPDVTLRKIWYDDRVIWEGTALPTIGGVSVVTIDEPDFFGEGNGIGGSIRYYGGNINQDVDNFLAANGQSPTPAYRHLAYATFEDFYWGNSPAVKKIRFEVERYPDTLGLGAARFVQTSPDDSPLPPVDLSVMEIVHEVLSDPEFLNEPASRINTAQLTADAATLAAEANGASIKWISNSTLQDFIHPILRQIDGVLYFNQRLGKWTSKLARDESPRSVIKLDESNIVQMKKFSRGNWDETVNEVQVNFSSRTSTEKPFPAIQKDLSNFDLQGSHKNSTITMPAVYSRALANQIAAREIRQLAFPQAACDLVVNTDGKELNIGDVFEWEWNWPRFGIERFFMRIVQIKFNPSDNERVEISAAQDVFGLAESVLAEPDDTRFTEIAGPAQQIVNVFAADQNYFLVSNDPDNDNNSPRGETNKPFMLALRPQGNSLDYSLFARQGAAQFALESAGNVFARSGTLDSALARSEGPDTVDIDVTIPILNQETGLSDIFTQDEIRQQGAGLLVLVGTGASPNAEPEILGYESITFNGGASFTLNNCHRGLVDTVAVEAISGDRIWFLNDLSDTLTNDYGDAENVDLRLQNFTTGGSSDIDVAPITNVIFRDRPGLPYRAGGLTVGNEGSPLGPVRYPTTVETSDIFIAWKTRDRLTGDIAFEDDATDGDLTDVIYRLQIFTPDQSPELLRTVIVNGNDSPQGYTYTAANISADGGPFTNYRIEVRSFTNVSPLTSGPNSLVDVVREFQLA